MKECQDFQTIIQNFLADEIPPSELEALRRHCQSCPDCRALMDLHLELSELGEEAPEPREADLAAVRNSVLAQIARDPSRKRRAGKRWWDLGTVSILRPAFGLPLAAVLLVGAVFLGRWSVTPRTFDDDLLMQGITRQASQPAGLEGYWDKPFSYSNVSVRALAGGNVDLSFDVCRRVKLVTAIDSPVAKDVLLQAILAPAPLGSRMKAMELTPSTMDPGLEEALVFTMHNDPELAIRLEALSVLARFPYNARVREALLTTLRRDPAVQMRLLALDQLAGQQVGLEILRQAIQEANMESDPAVMQRALKLTGETMDRYQ